MGTHARAYDRFRWNLWDFRHELQRPVEPHGGVRLPDGNAVRGSELVESRPWALQKLLQRFWAGRGAELVDSLFWEGQDRPPPGIRLVSPAGAKLPGNRRQLYGIRHFNHGCSHHGLWPELPQPAERGARPLH